jgi:hypothetical protein
VIIDLYLLREVAQRSLNDYAKKNIGCEASLLVDEFAEKLLEELDYEQVCFRSTFTQSLGPFHSTLRSFSLNDYAIKNDC